MMMPDRCSVISNGKRCQNPPAHIISVLHDMDEYMVGMACQTHRHDISERVRNLQKQGEIPSGYVQLTPLKAVGTDCIKGDPDDYIRIEGSGHASGV